MLRRRYGTRESGISFTFLPAIHTSPRSGRSWRLIRRNSVDLPEPDGPTRNTKSPFAMSKLTSRTATVSAPYTFVTLSRRIMTVGTYQWMCITHRRCRSRAENEGIPP